MLSSQEEQIERARTLENDRKVREQGSTFLSHTHSDLGGRYALGKSHHSATQSTNLSLRLRLRQLASH